MTLPHRQSGSLLRYFQPCYSSFSLKFTVESRCIVGIVLALVVIRDPLVHFLDGLLRNESDKQLRLARLIQDRPDPQRRAVVQMVQQPLVQRSIVKAGQDASLCEFIENFTFM